MRFPSRTTAFARRVFPTRNKLIREPGCIGNITTPATTWNSRFAESIPRLTGIFTGRTHENISGTPTSGSHNSLVRTSICANFIPLERGRREISGDMLHDPFRVPEDLQNCPKKSFQKRIRVRNRGRFGEVLAWRDKTATWQLHGSRGIIMCRAA